MIHGREDYNRIQDPAGIIPADEPVFLIRGRDITAPATLRFYALTAEKFGATAAFCDNVRRHADLIETYQAVSALCSKVPDGVGDTK